VKFAWDAQKESGKNEEKGLRERNEKLAAEVAGQREREAVRIKAEGAAASFYELVRAERRQDMIEGWDGLQKQPLSRAEHAFLGDSVDRARQELSIQAYQVGMEHVRMGRWQEAEGRLQESLRLKPNASHSPGAKLAYARALRKLGKPRDAIPKLTELAEASADKEVMDDAAFLLAECLVDVESWNEAKAALRSFLRRFPDSPFVNDARTLLADIAQKR
jgi:TolA-binding protein